MGLKYIFEGRVSKEMVLMDGRYGPQVWTKIQLRKITSCQNCRQTLNQNDSAYRPITNKSNRMERICFDCMKELEKDAI